MSLRFGVVGTGYWASEVHVPGLRATPGAELVGIWGRDPGRASALAERNGARAFARYEDMLAAVDAVDFSVPPDVQGQLAVAAAEAGKHLLLEKPVSRSPATAARLAAAVARRGLASVVFFTRRFVPEIERALEALARERWREAEVQVHSGAMLPGSPFAPSLWRQEDGAALWDIGPHALSLIVPVLGAVERVGASRGADRIVRMRTEHRGGAAAEVSLSLHAKLPAPIASYAFRAGERRATLPDPPFKRPEALARCAGELIAATGAAGHAHRCDAAFGVMVTRVLAAASRGVETGKLETVPAGEG